MSRALALLGVIVLSSWLLLGLWFLRKVRSLDEDNEPPSEDSRSAHPVMMVSPRLMTDAELFAMVLADRISRRARQLSSDEMVPIWSYIAAREVLAVFLGAKVPDCMEAIDDFLTCNEIAASSPAAREAPGEVKPDLGPA